MFRNTFCRDHQRLLSLTVVASLLTFAVAAPSQPLTSSLRIYAIDVDARGGKATLYVFPSGESMLFDTGFDDSHDADRIVAAAKDAGVKQIDYLVISHYHSDHVGGVAQLAAKIPIKAFFDHGELRSAAGKAEKATYEAYTAVRQKYPHTTVKPGDTIPVKGVRVDIIAAAGETIAKPLAGAGQPNPLCADYSPTPFTKGQTENNYSVAMMITFGRLRIVDFADLTSNSGERLTCPVNNLGTVDIYMTARHGGWNPPEIVHALRPRIAIMDNSKTHWGSVENWVSFHTSPGFEDLWQLHWSELDGADHNSQDNFIVNPTETDRASGSKSSRPRTERSRCAIAAMGSRRNILRPASS